MKKINIIVPVYNTEKYLYKCLESLMNQTIIDQIEVIIINDGTKDNSEKIIRSFLDKYPSNIKYYKQNNLGLSAARNLGLEKCSCEYVGFVDSDDYVDKTMYEKLYACLLENQADISICAIAKCDIYGKIINYEEAFDYSMIDGITMKNMLLSCNIGCYAWNKLYKRKLFYENKIIYPVGRVYEDIIPMYKLSNIANKISFINEPLYYYVQRNNSICNKTNIETALDMLVNIKDLLKYGENSNDFITIWFIESNVCYYKCIINNTIPNNEKLIKRYIGEKELVEKAINIKQAMLSKNLLYTYKIKLILYKLGVLRYVYFFVTRYDLAKNYIARLLI